MGLNKMLVYWRINYRHLNLLFQHEICARVMTKRYGKEYGQIIAVFLKTTKTFNDILSQVRMIPLKTEKIASEIVRLIGNNLSHRMIESEILCQLHYIVTFDGYIEIISTIINIDSQKIYSVNTVRILELNQFRQIEVVIRKRFGDEAVRIAKQINAIGPMEQKQISNICLVHLNKTRELMYRMMKRGYANIITFHQTNTNSTATTKLLWKLDLRSVKEQVRSDLYQTACNILERISKEIITTNKTSNKNSSSTFKTSPNESPSMSASKEVCDFEKKASVKKDILLGSLILIDENIAEMY